MKYFTLVLTVISLNACSYSPNMKLDSNTRPEDYMYIKDPTETFNMVHKFSITSDCNKKLYKTKKGSIHYGKGRSDCSYNSVRSELYEEVWEDHRPGEKQPIYMWYTWDVYLPNNFPILESGKLLLGQFHNSDCPHLSFTSRGGMGGDNGILHYETMRIYGDDCLATERKPITKIQEMWGKWTNFLLEIKWSSNEDGIANIWIDGKQVLWHKGRTLTKSKEHRNYLKIGIYQCCNKQWKKIKPATAYFTHPIAGPTRESLE